MFLGAVRVYKNVIQADNDENVYKWVHGVCHKMCKSRLGIAKANSIIDISNNHGAPLDASP